MHAVICKAISQKFNKICTSNQYFQQCRESVRVSYEWLRQKIVSKYVPFQSLIWVLRECRHHRKLKSVHQHWRLQMIVHHRKSGQKTEYRPTSENQTQMRTERAVLAKKWKWKIKWKLFLSPLAMKQNQCFLQRQTISSINWLVSRTHTNQQI